MMKLCFLLCVSEFCVGQSAGSSDDSLSLGNGVEYFLPGAQGQPNTDQVLLAAQAQCIQVELFLVEQLHTVNKIQGVQERGQGRLVQSDRRMAVGQLQFRQALLLVPQLNGLVGNIVGIDH